MNNEEVKIPSKQIKFHSQFIRTFSAIICLTLKEEFAALSMADIIRNVGVKLH